MRNFLKKVVSLVMIVSVLTISAFAGFVDMPANEVEKAALLKAVENGLIKGISETEIAPYMTMTRAQVGTIVVRAMGATREVNIAKFRDASKTAWYYTDLSRAVAMGAFEGDGGSSIYPNKEITYQEAFLVLSRVFDLRYEKVDALDGYADKDSVAKWAKSGVAKIVSGGYYDGAKLNPTAPISRVEFAKVMDKMVTTYIDTPGTYTNLPKGNTLVRCDGVIFDGVEFDNVSSVNEGDLIIIGDGVKKTTFKDIKGVNAAIRGGSA
ncbi:MAG: S-layer homology domain-containing protein, partial [Clostridia bacterium]|nr:S-layer homology domain-containing protein [Clostridia bacterium]